jgi:protein-S-isoprenylcysteine O-methyltransferase Ste14
LKEKRSNLIWSTVFLVTPGTFAGLIPWWISGWHSAPAFFGIAALRVLGWIFIAAGILFLLDSFARFALQGLGTPAPWKPPTRLVVTGAYRYVRNPMYVANLGLIVGQALVLGNLELLGYAVIAALLFHVFVISYEEPTLRQIFGAEYETMCSSVNRWIPRLTPWSAP